MNRLLLSLSAAALLAGCKADAPAPPVAAPADARAFVVEFYGWYQPDSLHIKGLDTALAARRVAFVAPLAAALDSEQSCVTRTQGVCDLEADPFFNSQDPCERYEVGGTLMHGDSVGVSVFGVCSGKRDTVPAVIAMVVKQDSSWRFADFAYPNAHTTLAAMLQRPSHR